MKLVDDNLAGIRQDFSGGEALPVIALMTEWQKEGAGFSVTGFCIVLFTKHMAISRELAGAADLARRDPRDLIVGAEYDG